MASISKLASGRYQAKVRRNGVSASKTFKSLPLAKQWAKDTEYQVERNLFVDCSSSERTTVNQLMIISAIVSSSSWNVQTITFKSSPDR